MQLSWLPLRMDRDALLISTILPWSLQRLMMYSWSNGKLELPRWPNALTYGLYRMASSAAVYAAVHRREHALVEGCERKLNGLETLVGNNVDAACRSGDVEFNAANDRYLANLARDKVQVGEMPLVRAVRIGGVVVVMAIARKTAVLGRLHHFTDGALNAVGYIGGVCRSAMICMGKGSRDV